MMVTENDCPPLTISHLERHPLSAIASFLTEVEGTSFFLTRKVWTRTLLPVFRVPDHKIKLLFGDHRTVPGKKKNRHRFVVVPVQDATTRLSRLNTRRWKKQKLKCSGMSTEQYAISGRDLGYPPILRLWRTSDSPFKSGTTVLASYPRSGNTLLRSLLESITGYVTGSDTRPDRTLSLALAERHDLIGEGLILPTQTAIVKTHWPERIGYRGFLAQRAILLVRNPFDAIDSYWNLNLTNTHTEKVTDEVYQQHEAFFQKLVLNEIKVWIAFIEFWSLQPGPLLWVRYEDLIQHTQEELLRILIFATCKDENHWLARVQFVLQREGHGYRSLPSRPESTDDIGTPNYSEKDKALPFGRSLKRYSLELLHQMHDLDEHGWLEKFGYHLFLQSFPHNVSCEKHITFPGTDHFESENRNDTQATLSINKPTDIELRSPHCLFGRNMREWRRKYTNDDTQPFPTTRSA